MKSISGTALSGRIFRCCGGARCLSHTIYLLECLRARCWDRFSSPSTCHHWDLSFRNMFFSHHCCAEDTQLFLSLQPDDQSQLTRHFLLDEGPPPPSTQPCEDRASPTLHHIFNIQLGTSTKTPSRNLVVMIDDQLSFTDHIARTAGPADFPYTTSGGSGPSYWSIPHNSSSKVLLYPYALLAGLPAWTVNPLKLIQNAAARVFMSWREHTL